MITDNKGGEIFFFPSASYFWPEIKIFQFKPVLILKVRRVWEGRGVKLMLLFPIHKTTVC